MRRSKTACRTSRRRTAAGRRTWFVATAAVLLGSLATGYVSVSVGESSSPAERAGQSQPVRGKQEAAPAGLRQLPPPSPASLLSIEPYTESGGEFGLKRYWTPDARLMTVAPSDSAAGRTPLPMMTRLASQQPAIMFDAMPSADPAGSTPEWRVRGPQTVTPQTVTPVATGRRQSPSSGSGRSARKASPPNPIRPQTGSKALVARSNHPARGGQASPSRLRSVVLVEAIFPSLEGHSASQHNPTPTLADPSASRPGPLVVPAAKRLSTSSLSQSGSNGSVRLPRTAPAAGTDRSRIPSPTATAKLSSVLKVAERPRFEKDPAAERLISLQPPARPTGDRAKGAEPRPIRMQPTLAAPAIAPESGKPAGEPSSLAAKPSLPAAARHAVDHAQLAKANRIGMQPREVAPAIASENGELAGKPSSPAGVRPVAKLAQATRRAPAPLEPLSQLIKPSSPTIRIARQPSPSPIPAPASPAPADPSFMVPDDAVYYPPTVGPDGQFMEEVVDDPYGIYSPGEWTGCGVGCPPSRYAYTEALWMNREGPRVPALSNGFLFIPGDDYELGVRATIGRRFDCTDGWEASYAGLFEWDRSVERRSGSGGLTSLLITGGGITPADIEAFNGAAHHRQSYNSKLDSIEINRMWWGWDVFAMYMGFRYLRVEEDMLFVSIDSDGDVGLFSVDTKNNLIGAQLGANVIYPVGRLNLASKVKVGAFVNIDEGDTTLINDGNFLLVNGVDDAEFAAMIEYGLYATYEITPHIRARAGYEFWWVYGLALAGRQNTFFITPLTGQRLNEDDDIFYHGGTAGIEISF